MQAHLLDVMLILNPYLKQNTINKRFYLLDHHNHAKIIPPILFTLRGEELYRRQFLMSRTDEGKNLTC